MHVCLWTLGEKSCKKIDGRSTWELNECVAAICWRSNHPGCTLLGVHTRVCQVYLDFVQQLLCSMVQQCMVQHVVLYDA